MHLQAANRSPGACKALVAISPPARPAFAAVQPRPPHRRSAPAAPAVAAAAASGAPPSPPLAAREAPGAERAEREVRPGVFEGTWAWQGHSIRYQRCGDAGPPVVCVHGFGGNADHWRKNLPELGLTCRAYAIDLLGYGYSSKPDPRAFGEPNALYNFENWGLQLRDFVAQVVGEPAVLSCNSVGGLAGLQAAGDDSSLILAVQVINISLRMLHVDKQASWQRPAVRALQRALRTTGLGPAFFGQIATRQGVASVLKQCYGDAAAVTDELVDVILTPGLQEGAVHVFLDFISYSSGPLPETLLQSCPVPVSVIWGEADPWEKLEWGREFAKYEAVEEFVSLPGVGHCPQDEAPHLVNPLILSFVARHARQPAPAAA
jgi:pimeloyl-ACP methyl ester carboxylesterase